jgi:hypothetical protein
MSTSSERALRAAAAAANAGGAVVNPRPNADRAQRLVAAEAATAAQTAANTAAALGAITEPGAPSPDPVAITGVPLRTRRSSWVASGRSDGVQGLRCGDTMADAVEDKLP